MRPLLKGSLRRVKNAREEWTITSIGENMENSHPLLVGMQKGTALWKTTRNDHGAWPFPF